MGAMQREEEETYTTAEAAHVLRKDNRRVLRMLETGELEGEKDNAGRWRIPQKAVHELLPGQVSSDRSRAFSEKPLEVAQEAAELWEIVRDLERELGRMEGRLELTAVTESTLREQLERERERADRLEAELRDAEADVRAAEAALYDARRPWWRRFFGFQ